MYIDEDHFHRYYTYMYVCMYVIGLMLIRTEANFGGGFKSDS